MPVVLLPVKLNMRTICIHVTARMLTWREDVCEADADSVLEARGHIPHCTAHDAGVFGGTRMRAAAWHEQVVYPNKTKKTHARH